MASKLLVTLVLFFVSVCTARRSKLSYAGVNIAGFDFGCDTDGHCDLSRTCPPLPQFGSCGDGPAQMQHFVNDDGFNTFRLPCGWQYLTYGKMTGTLNETQFANYNMLVQACLDTGAHCIVDIHNYARYDGQASPLPIIGQGGPSNEVFAELWRGIADHWKHESRIVFGLMNEPRDLDINIWADTVQAAVTAIRATGATSQKILLPGTGWTSAATFVSSGSADVLNKVTNPDGSITHLLMDVHRYLDADNSGNNAECVSNSIQDAWEPLTEWLQAHGRQALVTETGGGNVDSCFKYLGEQIDFFAHHSHYILGYCGWGAGAFKSWYVLDETPVLNADGSWTDTPIVAKVLSPKANGCVIKG